jgi:hypothetical protein
MYGRPLTPEERMMQQILSRQNNPYGTPTTMESQVNAAVNAPMTPGTGGFGAPPVPTDLKRQAMAARTQDFTDRQSAVDSQRAIAQQMRSGKSPEGRTVGPYDVYVAPNWGEVAGDVATKLGGGYLEGRANKEGAKIDEARSNAALEKALEEKARFEAQEAREDTKLDLLVDAAEPEQEYTEFSDGETTLRGYTKDGIGYDEKGQQLPDGFTELQKVATSRSSVPFQAITKEDPWGNVVVTSFNKENQVLGQPRFIDGTPYSPEEGERRGGVQADQAGNVESAKQVAQTLVEQYGEAGDALMANNAAIGQYKIAKQALKEGANTGPIVSKLPGNWTAATTKLANARDSQALTQIAAYTFGSLSEAEGDWLKDTSIPMGLNEEELDVWLDKRIEGFERASASERYRLDEIKAGRQPDPQVMEQIKYGGGFTWE